MALNWNNLQSTVDKVMKSQGLPVVIRVDGSDGTWDPDSMSYTGGDPDVDHSTFGIKENYSSREIDGTIIQQNDAKLIIPAKGLPVITTATKILISGTEQNIINVSIVDPGNVALLYEIQLRN